MDTTYQIKCKECGLVLNSPESLEVHRQYHEGHLMQQWAQKTQEKNNNHSNQSSPEYSTASQEAQYNHPPTPQSYQSSSSPYQIQDYTQFQPFQVKTEDYLTYYQPDYPQKFTTTRYNPYSRPVYYPPQPTPSPSPKQCDKCGYVCENAVQLIEHNNLNHPVGLQSYYQPYEGVKEEESEILDLDSQKVVHPNWGEKDKVQHTVQGMLSWSGSSSQVGYGGGVEFLPEVTVPVTEVSYEPVQPVQPVQPATTKSTNWKSNEARRPKTYNCTACNKWFTSSGHLKRHYNTTLHKNAVKSSGQPDPAQLPISAHHHPARDSASSKDAQNSDSTSSDSVVEMVPVVQEQYQQQQYPNELAPHVTHQAMATPITGDLLDQGPLPSFAQIQAQLQGYACVGGMGQYNYCPDFTRPPLLELENNNLLPQNEEVSAPAPAAQQQEQEEVKENVVVVVPASTPTSEESKTKCYDCDKVFNRPCYLTQHNKTFHNGDKPFKCSRCGKRFPDDETFRRHTKKHAGDKPHKCDMCPKMFNHKTDLRRHLCCHTGRKPYACEICGKGFIRKDHMIKHMDTHTRKREKMAAIRS